GNRYVNKLLPGHWGPRSETTASADGSYTLTVLPGPGAIGVRAPKVTAYAPALVTVQERRHFFKTRLAPFNNDDRCLDTAVGGSATSNIWVDFYNAMVLIEPGEEERAVVRDIALERPEELRGRILGPDSQPVMGTTIYGLSFLSDETVEGSEFTV